MPRGSVCAGPVLSDSGRPVFLSHRRPAVACARPARGRICLFESIPAAHANICARVVGSLISLLFFLAHSHYSVVSKAQCFSSFGRSIRYQEKKAATNKKRDIACCVHETFVCRKHARFNQQKPPLMSAKKFPHSDAQLPRVVQQITSTWTLRSKGTPRRPLFC